MALAGGRAGERGSVAVLLALALTALLGFAALVVDVGLSWAVRAEAQTAADAAALAGAARLADGPVAAVAAVRQYLDANVPGLADRPADPNWPLNGTDDDGEVVCWTPPAPPPAPGAGCPAGSTAVQVTTPPIPVQYAFASVLGPAANSIRALAAATAGGLPGAPGPACGLCLLDPLHGGALAVAGRGDVVVEGGGVTVNSSHPDAAILSDSGDVVAEQIVVGGVVLTGSGRFVPPPTTGAPRPSTPWRPCPPRHAARTATLLLRPGDGENGPDPRPRRLRQHHGHRRRDPHPRPGRLRPDRVPGPGRPPERLGPGHRRHPLPHLRRLPNPLHHLRRRLHPHLQRPLHRVRPTTGPYANLTLFSDRANPTPLLLATTADTPTATIYASNARLLLAATGDLKPTHPLILARLTTLSTGSVRVTLDPPSSPAAPSSPVLIR